MFNDYQDEKNEYSETKYLNEELKGVRCKILNIYEKGKDGELILEYKQPAIRVQFRVEEGLNTGSIYYENFNFNSHKGIVKGVEKTFHPWKLKNIILACGFQSKDDPRKVEPLPFSWSLFIDFKPELYIDFEFSDKENQKYLKIKKVYSLEEFQKEKIVFNDRIEVADKIYEASKEEVKENIPF